MLISHTPVRGVILKYFGENHTLCVKFEPNWTRCKQLEEGIKSLACGSWFYPFLSLFANSFNLERYSSRGGQEKPLGWRLGVFLDHHSMNILINTPRSNKILPRVLPKYSRLRLEYFGRTLGSILLLLGVFISNSTIVWFSLKYFRQKRTMPKRWRRENVEIGLESFESLNGTTDFLLWNSEQGTGEWLLIRKLFGTFFTSKGPFLLNES